jgi:hypothetical protein
VKVFGVSESDDSTDGFWRIALGEHKETCFLMSSKSLQLVDFRVYTYSFHSCVDADPYRIQAAERGVKVYSIAGPDMLTSIKCIPDDGLSQLVTTNKLVWVDTRQHIRPMLAWKHERERDRTLSSHAVCIGGGRRR